MLRVAENLDRSHSQVISRVEVKTRKDHARLELHTNGDAELEFWATGRHIAPFEQVIGRPVRLAMVVNTSPPPVPAEPRRPRAASGPARRRTLRLRH
jgi:hypothetical protein